MRGVEIKGAERAMGAGWRRCTRTTSAWGARGGRRRISSSFRARRDGRRRENARDDAETTENLIAYVMDALKGDGGGDDGLESNVVVGAGRWLRARVVGRRRRRDAASTSRERHRELRFARRRAVRRGVHAVRRARGETTRRHGL